MTPRITLITLGVDDLPRALAFYRDGLGFASEGIVGEQFDHGAVAFFDLEQGLRLALWPRSSLAKDSGLGVGPRNPTEFCLAHNVASAAEVDSVMQQAQGAGGAVVKPPHKTFWGGYAAYFQDLDGHLWEVAWNPAMLPAAAVEPPPALPEIPLGRYRHYKGGEYEVFGVARHSESREVVVVYRPLYNATGLWVRPFEMFTGSVIVDGQPQRRFAPVGDE